MVEQPVKIEFLPQAQLTQAVVVVVVVMVQIHMQAEHTLRHQADLE